MKTPTEWTHNGHTITLANNGEFGVTLDGRCIRKPSLKAMKDFLDQRGKHAMKPFTAYVQPGWRSSIRITDVRKVQIVRIECNSNRHSMQPYFYVGSDGNRYFSSNLIPDTPSAVAKLKTYITNRRHAQRIISQQEARIARDLEALEHVPEPTEYLVKGGAK